MLTLSRFLRQNIAQQRNSLRSQALSAKRIGVSIFKWVQCELLAERDPMITAALIEVPQCVRPNQRYVLRIHLMGSGEPKEDVMGLGALVQGEIVHIEVYSTLNRDDAYLVQKTDVSMPGSDTVVVVTVPMLPLAREAVGRYQRLRIFFLNELDRPLYMGPFVVDVYVSSLVTRGHEGYNTVRIPM